MDSKDHWERVYQTKQAAEVSWYQPVPKVSLDFVSEFGLAKGAAVIDIGGGDSLFADHLLDLGYTDITVLDISETALQRARLRMGERASAIKWIVSDILLFTPERTYDFWHDRATFHFFTTEKQVARYLGVAHRALSESGNMVLGTFSESGPDRCSGLPVKQYSETGLVAVTKKWFRKIKCIHADHITPFNTVQNFLFCHFKKTTYGVS